MSFKLAELDASHPFIESALRTYLQKYRIERAGPQPPKHWWGLYEDGEFALAFGYLHRDDGGIELTDVYLHPSKRGFRAVKYAGGALMAALQQGVFPYCLGSTFARNKRALKWLADYCQKPEPDIAGFVLAGATLDLARRRVLEGAD